MSNWNHTNLPKVSTNLDNMRPNDLNELKLKPCLHIAVIVVSTVANMFLTVPSNFDTRDHFDYNIASFMGNCYQLFSFFQLQ